MATISTSTGFYPLDKAIKLAKELNESDDWTYTVEDCKNGLGRIDVHDEEGELVIKGFKL